MTTRMDPQHFHDTLEKTVRGHEQGSPDVSAAVSDDLAAGRRLLRRRQRRTVAGAVVGALAVGVAAAVAIPAREPDNPIASDRVSLVEDDAALLERCREGYQDPEVTELIFGQGSPTIKARTGDSRRVAVVLEASGGGYWGACVINLDPRLPARGDGIMVYDSAVSTTDDIVLVTPGCEVAVADSACGSRSWLRWDRLPARVATVEFRTVSGEVFSVEPRDGYYLFDYTAEALGAATQQDSRRDPRPDAPPRPYDEPLARITYLAADGTPLAAEAPQPRGRPKRVGDLPILDSIPSLRGSVCPQGPPQPPCLSD